MNLYHVTTFDTLFPFTCLSTVNDFNKNTDSFTLVVSIRIFWGVITDFPIWEILNLNITFFRKRDVKSLYCFFFLYFNNLRQHDMTTRLLTYSLSPQEFRLPFGQRFEFCQLWFEKYHGKEGKWIDWSIVFRNTYTGNSWRFYSMATVTIMNLWMILF